jgi:hypothetical protein
VGVFAVQNGNGLADRDPPVQAGVRSGQSMERPPVFGELAHAVHTRTPRASQTGASAPQRHHRRRDSRTSAPGVAHSTAQPPGGDCRVVRADGWQHAIGTNAGSASSRVRLCAVFAFAGEFDSELQGRVASRSVMARAFQSPRACFFFLRAPGVARRGPAAPKGPGRSSGGAAACLARRASGRSEPAPAPGRS